MSTDLFSKQSNDYARFRPKYPTAFFHALFERVKDFECAWDCATGNGQAAISLSEKFEKVIATDFSQAQIQNAIPHEGVEYRCEPSEKTSLGDQSVSLITVAQAAHWFQFDAFYREVNRVLKPGGLIAIFGYHFSSSDQPEIDRAIQSFAQETLGSYWKPQNRILWNAYRDIEFPFQEIALPRFQLSVDMNFDEMMGYISSWSATQLYRDQTGKDPILEFKKQLLPLWKNPQSKLTHRWDLVGRVGESVSDTFFV